MSKLVCLAGLNKGDQFLLHEGKNIVGRSKDCQVVLFDKKCSRQHCLIYKRDHHYSIKDLESSNGTTINGRRISSKTAVCEPGDVLQLGETTMRISERGIGGVVDQTCNDAAADLQGAKYETLLKNTARSIPMQSAESREQQRKGITQLIKTVFPWK